MLFILQAHRFVKAGGLSETGPSPDKFLGLLETDWGRVDHLLLPPMLRLGRGGEKIRAELF
jgi:hypothetical protein